MMFFSSNDSRKRLNIKEKCIAFDCFTAVIANYLYAKQ